MEAYDMNLGAYTFRRIARESLRGRWLKAIVAGIIAVWLGAYAMTIPALCEYVAVISVLMLILEFIPGYYYVLLSAVIAISIYYFFVGGVVRLGHISFNLALLDRRRLRYSILTSHLNLWWKMICARMAILFLTTIGLLFFVIPGIFIHYSCAMTPYMLEQKPDYTMSQSIMASFRIMAGHRWQLFALRFSFLGWNFLSMLTLGIGFLFVIPYRSLAETVFYNEISGRADVFYGRYKNKQDQDSEMTGE